MKRRIALILSLVAFCLFISANVPPSDDPSIVERDALAGVWPNGLVGESISLNGLWDIKVEEGIADGTDVPGRDESWTKAEVPGCWEIQGLCSPKYDKSAPLTGYCHREFSLPEKWFDQRVILRLDGVLYAYYLWINGQYVGEWRSAFNTALYDITPFLSPDSATQHLEMRILTQHAAVGFDFFDDWALSGIFRDVSLISVPATHISDFEVRTLSLTPDSATLSFSFEAEGDLKKTSVEASIISPDGLEVGSFTLPLIKDGNAEITLDLANPKPWTAETPSLYVIKYSLKQGKKILQNFSDKFGIRKLTIDGNRLMLNGVAIKLRGVTSHATCWQTGKVISDSLTLTDMKLMKQASINYIRTSHYPREPRFYELADSLGFYIIDEIPFGRGEENMGKAEYYPQLRQRAQATVKRDKNHPSVLIWSLGNENPLPDPCLWLAYYVKDTLCTDKPICYPQVGSFFMKFNYDLPKIIDIYAPHYPRTGQLSSFYAKADRPVIFTEYCHTLGISLEDHDRQWEIIEKTPCIAGGSVWEWVDQAVPFQDSKQDFFGYEERVWTSPSGGFQMNGNKGTDGILYADRTPLPNYYELRQNYSQASILTDTIVAPWTDGEVGLEIRNRYDFINLLGNVSFRYCLLSDRDTIAKGEFSPDCAPKSSVTHNLRLPLDKCDPEAVNLLEVEAMKEGTGAICRQTIRINPTNLGDRIIKALDKCEGTSDFTTLLRDSILVRAGRKATMAERIRVRKQRVDRYLIEPTDSAGCLVAHSDKCDIAMTIDISKSESGALSRIDFSLTPDSSETFLSELGLALPLDASIDRVRWIGNGPLPTYPGRYQTGQYGSYSMREGHLYFEGNRHGVDAVIASDSLGNGILIVADNADINFEQTDEGMVLSLNVAVSGQGPKFGTTDFPVIAKKTGTLRGTFYACRITPETQPELINRLFGEASSVEKPFKPFLTQYDTYLMRYADIKDK